MRYFTIKEWEILVRLRQKNILLFIQWLCTISINNFIYVYIKKRVLLKKNFNVKMHFEILQTYKWIVYMIIFIYIIYEYIYIYIIF